MAVVFALAALVMLTASDFVFREESKFESETPVLLFFFYMSAAAFALSALSAPRDLLALAQSRVTMLGSLTVGATAVVCYTLYLTAFTGVQAAVNSTMFRLGSIFAMLFGILLLRESVTWSKLAALAGCCAAILLFLERDAARPVRPKYLLCSVLASVVCGLVNPFTKLFIGLGARSGPLLCGRFFFMAALSAAVLMIVRVPFRLSRRSFLFALGSGALLYGACFFILEGLKIGEASVVSPISNMSFVLTALLSVAVFRERLSRRKLYACALAVLSICILIFF